MTELHGALDICTPGRIAGWVFVPHAPPPPIELHLGPRLLATTRADRPRPDLAAAGFGTGGHGFLFQPDGLAEADLPHLRLVIAGTGHLLAQDAPVPTPADRHLRSLWSRPPGARRFHTAILHIGTEKTGSSTLQSWLALNRTALAARGFHVPVALAPNPWILNHEHLALLALDEADPFALVRRGTTPQRLWAARAAVFGALAAEIEAAPACACLLLSGEHCHSELTSASALRRLALLLAAFADRVEVHVYLRPQHELAVSRHGMALMLGRLDVPMLPRLTPMEALYFDYQALLDRWGAVFGISALHPHLFDRASLVGGSIVTDFTTAIGIDAACLPATPDINGNISPQAQSFLAAFYATARGQALSAPARAVLAAELRAIAPGRGAQPCRAEVDAFQAQFAAGNEAVRAAWFPGRATLFNPDLSAYPAARTAPGRPTPAQQRSFSRLAAEAERFHPPPP